MTEIYQVEQNKCMAVQLDAPPYHLPIFSNGPPNQMIKKKDMTNLALITHVNLDDLRNITKTSCQVYDDLII